jgi:hypothetical protein
MMRSLREAACLAAMLLSLRLTVCVAAPANVAAANPFDEAAAARFAALPAVTGEHYQGGHWLGTFAVYLTSKAGVR